MSLFGRTTLVFALALFFAGAAPRTRAQGPEAQTVIRVDVDLVQIDAVVTDADDEPVTDLTAEDFIVLQDGKPQEITHFSLIRTGAAAPPVPTAAAGAKETQIRVAPPPPVPLRPDAVRRTIALVVDDLGLAMDTMMRVRQSIREWIENEMRPGDLVAVMRTGGSVGALQQFTNDRRMLLAAADRLSYNAASRVGASSFQPLSGMKKERKDSHGFALPMPEEERDLQFTQFSIASIQYIVDGLKDLPGRKSMILFSEHLEMNFDANSGQNQGRGFVALERMHRLIDSANRSAVVIHSIDPRGVVYTGFTAEDNPWGNAEDFAEATPDKISETFSQRDAQLIRSQDGMAVLSHQTGGLFLYNRNDIGGALQRAASDGDGYYLLGYQPDSATVSEMQEGKANLHRIRVRVKRAGLRVRSRSEFLSAAVSKATADSFSRQRQVEKALSSPFGSEDLRVRLTPLFSQTKDSRPVINALVHFDAGPLTFSPQPDGWMKASVELTAGLYGAEGRVRNLDEKTWNIQARGRDFERMKKNGLSFRMSLPAGDPGAYQMRIVVRDAASGRIGSAAEFVEVPDLRDGKLALSGILLAAGGPDSGSPADPGEDSIGAADNSRTAAVRIFEPGDTIALAYQVLNAKTGEDRKPRLQSQLRLFREGREFFTGKPSLLAAEPQAESGRMIAADRMRFDRLPPGYYVLQLAVTDMLAKEPRRTAVRSIDFDVRARE